MRVESGAGSAGGGAERCAARFEEALARAARDGRRGSDRVEGSAQVRGPGASQRSRLLDVRGLEGPWAGERPGGGGADLGPPPTADGGRAGAAEPAAIPELAAVARAVPPAVARLGSEAGGALALTFGPSLSVELRSTAAGVELLLRPDAAHARAVEAELPRLVAALRVRGVAVAHAGIGPRLPVRARAR